MVPAWLQILNRIIDEAQKENETQFDREKFGNTTKEKK